MPFWQRRAKEATYDSSYVEQTTHQVKQDLADGMDPRESIAVDLMLRWLWQLDTAKVKAMYPLLAAPGTDLADYARFAYSLPLPEEMPEEGRMHAGVTNAVRQYLTQRLLVEQAPSGINRENLRSNAGDVANGVAMVARLRMAGAHEIVCRLLFAANYRHQKRSGNTGVSVLDDPQYIIKITGDCLLALPPDEIPYFWAKLKLAGTDHDLGPVVARMRDRRAVPFMVEALPALDLDIAANVVVALGNMKDMRAVPALQEIAANKNHPVSHSAAQALALILSGSRDDAAMLLRPTDSRHSGKAAETLLRPAAGNPDATTRRDELLRAGDRPPNERTDTDEV